MRSNFLLLISLFSLASATASAQTAGSVRDLTGSKWIWDQADAHKVASNSAPRFVRGAFELADAPVKAELFVTCDNEYVAFVNGQKVGADKEWATIESYDVTRHLVKGKNVIAFEFRNAGGVAGAIARLRVQTADKKELAVVSGTLMRITQNVEKGIEWTKADFNDSGWFAANELGPVGIAPWNLGGGGGAVGTSGFGYDFNKVDPNVKARISAEEQKKHFVVPDGFEMELVAADPLVINPITMAMDEKGRLYVSESHTYRYGPSGSPVKPFANPVVRLDPTADGKGFKRTLIADGFADPVMGIAIRDGKIWLTACNFLYRYDLADDGTVSNRKTLLIDKNKAWNPFGMFVLEWGPDGLLYMSVGDHAIAIQGPDGAMSGRRNSGIIMRMNPDGARMERLAQGFRVPYSFDMDPFGQLWLLSNGEGNPNRFTRIIEGVDYHCYSRQGVDNNWLAGKSPLAPPVIELHRGACTQLMRYYGSAYPDKYQGSLLLDNWGAHGFSGPNRGIFRFVPDADGNIITKEPFIACTDPHFRPSHILLDTEGNVLVSDWYGRDDESDMTGRIWRLKYVGKDRPAITHKIDSADWSKDDYVLSALGSPQHLIREKATAEAIRKGNAFVAKLAEHAASAKQPIGGAYALWSLARIDTAKSKAALQSGIKNADPQVRRLALTLLRRYQVEGSAAIAQKTLADPAPMVRVEAAKLLVTPDAIRSAMFDALTRGAAENEFLRYEAAWHIAKNADADFISKLLSTENANIRLAGLIAIDVAVYEDFPTKAAALAALGRAIENPGLLDHATLLQLVQLDGDARIVPALEKLVSREDLPLATTAKAIMLIKAKGGALSQKLSASAGKRLIEAVEKGALALASPADQLVLFEFLEAEGPTPFSLKQISGQLRSTNAGLRQASHVLARKFGTKSASLAPQLWAIVNDPKGKLEDTVEALSTVARIEETPNAAAWQKLLDHPQVWVRTEAIRWWRNFKGRPELVNALIEKAPVILKNDPAAREDLAAVLRHFEKYQAAVDKLNLPAPETDKAALTKWSLDSLTTLPNAERAPRAALGLQVFERSGCTKCHTTATQTTLLAPSLKGIAGQKPDYLVESMLYPSKIIKTGFDSERIETRNGKVHLGLVKEDGAFFRVLNHEGEIRVAKTDVETRTIAKTSIMPEGLEAQMSRREFLDVLLFLQTLK